MRTRQFFFLRSVPALITIFSLLGSARPALAAPLCVSPNEEVFGSSCAAKGWTDTKLGCGDSGSPTPSSVCVCCHNPAPPPAPAPAPVVPSVPSGGASATCTGPDKTQVNLTSLVTACPSGSVQTPEVCTDSTGAPAPYLSSCICCTQKLAPALCASGSTCQASCATPGTETGTCTLPDGKAASCCAASVAAASAAPVYVNALCFTQDQCTAPEYGGSIERFVPGQGCPNGQGKCLAPEAQIDLSHPIMGVKTVQGLRGYVFLGFQYLLNIVILTAAVMFVWAGFRYIFGSSIGDITRSKEIMVNATVGMLLTFGAVLILRTLNPATTTFEALKIYMLNKQEFSYLNRCADINKSGASSVKKFSDAGVPPGSIPFDADPKKFTVAGEVTQCGRDYYIQGTTGQTCKGSVCPTADALCMSCQGLSSAPDCAGKSSKGMGCVKTLFGGNVSWSDYTYPYSIVLVPVCYWAQPATTTKWGLGDVKKNVLPEVLPAGIYGAAPSDDASGLRSYSFNITDAQTQSWADACASKGKINGVLIGVVYHDRCSTLQSFQTVKAAKGTVGTTEAVVGAVGCELSPDDVLIVSKNDCKGANPGNKAPAAVPYYSGYVTTPATNSPLASVMKWTTAVALIPVTAGTSLVAAATIGDSEKSLLASAVYCGWRVTPKGGWTGSNGFTSRFNWAGQGPQNPYWSYDDLKAATGGKAIQCDFELNPTNAPRNPSGALMSGCGDTQDWDASTNLPSKKFTISSFF